MSETYSIGELSREFGVTPRAIRFYEDRGLLAPQRKGQMRVFGSRDRVRLRLILRGKRLGFSLAEIREYLDLYDADPSQLEQLRHLHRSVGARIATLQAQREALEQTLSELEDIRRQTAGALAEHGVAD